MRPFTVDLEKKDHLFGEISSEDPINVFLVNRYALNEFENKEEFSYEDCGGGEGIRKTSIDFAPTNAGRWFLVLRMEIMRRQVSMSDYGKTSLARTDAIRDAWQNL